jgi:phage gpG-like protein
MAFVVNVKIFGVEEVSEELHRGMVAVDNMTVVLDKVADDMMQVIARTFSGQGRRGGGSWQFLTENWLKTKERHNWDPRILFAQHWLVKSMTERGDDDQVLSVDDKSIRLDSSLPYAEIHQTGGEHIPARPYIDFLESDVSRWADMCETYIYAAMGGL